MSDERDIDLTALKGLNAPKVSEPARMAALNVAMGAFDDVQIEKAHLDNKKRQDTQENGEAARPRGDRFSFWSSPMTVVSNSLSRLRRRFHFPSFPLREKSLCSSFVFSAFYCFPFIVFALVLFPPFSLLF